MPGWLRLIRAEIASMGAPLLVVCAGVSFILAAAVLLQRGQDPAVSVRGVTYAWDNTSAAIALTLNLTTTWIGVIVVPFSVATGFATRCLHDTERLRALFQPSGVRRAAAGLAAATCSIIVVATIAGSTVIAASKFIASSGGAADLELPVSMFVAVLVMTMFWWSFSMLIAVAFQSTAATAVTPVALVMCCLPFSNLPALINWLPTTWLGRTTSVDSDGNTLTSLWSSNGGLLNSQWSADGPSWVPLIACSATMATATALLLSRRQRAGG